MRNSAGTVLAATLCASLLAIPDLTAEVRINSRIGGSCAPVCDQAEPSIAVTGATLVIGFNDTRYPGAVSGYAYSTDGGANARDADHKLPLRARDP